VSLGYLCGVSGVSMRCLWGIYAATYPGRACSLVELGVCFWIAE